MRYPDAAARIERALIFDGYVDEPACFGVPPYISPYVRYAAGALAMHGADVELATADAWRADRARWDSEIASSQLTIVIMGTTVPGRYRGGTPLSMAELAQIASMRRAGPLVLGGPIRAGYAPRGGEHARGDLPDGIDLVAHGDLEASIEIFLRTGEWDERALRSGELAARAAVLGAAIAERHPSWPEVICELEISRGCDRIDGRCSFCTEGAQGRYRERSAADTAAEVAALASHGVRAFRLGRCANALAYGGTMTDRGVRPNASAIAELYDAIRSAAPELEVLHTDNCNPATIARFPDESADAVAAIASRNTEGDGLSLGIESLDPAVIAANRLKVTADEAFLAVRVINEAGGRRAGSGLPSLLPGLNFLFGLAGETRETPAHDEAFLRRLLDAGLAVRRINIRRAMLFDGTPLARLGDASRLKERDYRRWRRWVREEVDPEMLARVAPNGTIIRRAIVEERRGSVAFARQLGSYPPLVGIVGESLQIGAKLDAIVTSRGGRSLTAVPYPLDIGSCERAQLEAIPGIGRARAEALLALRPNATPQAIRERLETTAAPPELFDELAQITGAPSS